MERRVVERRRAKTEGGERGPLARGEQEEEEGLERSRCHFHSSAFLFPLLRHLFFSLSLSPSTPAVLSTIRYISGHPRHCFRGISSELFARDSFRASTSPAVRPYPPPPSLPFHLSRVPRVSRAHSSFDFTPAEESVPRGAATLSRASFSRPFKRDFSSHESNEGQGEREREICIFLQSSRIYIQTNFHVAHESRQEGNLGPSIVLHVYTYRV